MEGYKMFIIQTFDDAESETLAVLEKIRKERQQFIKPEVDALRIEIGIATQKLRKLQKQCELAGHVGGTTSINYQKTCQICSLLFTVR